MSTTTSDPPKRSTIPLQGPPTPNNPLRVNPLTQTGPGKKKAALVLSGGGANAAFQVGVLQALDSEFEWTAVYGVSAGALNAVLMGQERLAHLRDVWIKETPRLVKRRRVWSFIYGLIFGTRGVFDADKLKDRVHELVSEAPFRIPTMVGYVNLKTSAYHLVGSHRKDFAKRVVASTSIPLLFDQPRLEDEPLADGGLRNSTPLADAIDAGHSRIVVISNRTRALKPGEDLKGFVSILERTLEILLHEIAENDIRQCARVNYLVKKAGGAVNGYRHVNLNVIRPSQDLGNMLDFSAEHVEEAILAGEAEGLAFLRGI